MVLRLPPRIRVILIPSDERSTHEIVLGRRAAALTIAIVALLALLAVAFLGTYATLTIRAAQVPRLQRELRESADQLAAVRELNRELEQMRRLQDQVLTMLGVPPAADAGGAGAARAGVDRPAPAAAPGAGGTLIAAPPPDLWPVGGYVTREFSPRAADGKTPGHSGLDIVAPVETPLKAAGKGMVTAAGWDGFLGNYVEITHGLGYVTVYGHCSRLAVRPGDRVDRGQEIAFLGGTGQASAPHLHFEVLKDGVAIDPRLAIGGDPPR